MTDTINFSLISETSVELGIYKHFKGNLYEVIGIARDSEDCSKQLVLYKQLQEGDFPIGTIWSRERNNFTTPDTRFVLQKETSTTALSENYSVIEILKRIITNVDEETLTNFWSDYSMCIYASWLGLEEKHLECQSTVEYYKEAYTLWLKGELNEDTV